MNKVDIVRKYIGNDDFYDMNGTPLLTKILAAMDEYAQQQVKNCSMPDIVLRSEHLVCDCTHTQVCKICAKSKDIDWDDAWDEEN